ncbi:MAG: ATP-binding protein [Candidatus Humimicrobiaceae bacterium]
MQRFFLNNLLDWKENPDRKALLVRGARQVGKTYLIRELGKTFSHFLEINFEMDHATANFFNGSLDPVQIIEKLSLYYGAPIVAGKTLLFFDEIQACPQALRSLRFFYEKMPKLHVASAGSLLEFVIAQIPSFGVGRIESLFLYPMTFFEFLEALGEGQLVDYIKSCSLRKPVDDIIHIKILGLFRKYQIIGGLPASVKYYAKNQNMLGSQKILDDLITTLTDDFAKYKNHISIDKMSEVFRSVALQNGSKFVYSRISPERSASYKKALELLVSAGLVYKIFHTSARGIPLGATIDENKFKVAMFDTGMLQRVSGLDLGHFIAESDFVNRGGISELSVCLALAVSGLQHHRPELYYWHREQRASSAEVDFVIAIDESIIPIEVKSGTKGAMQSLFKFLQERNCRFGIRISAENFTKYGTIAVIPIYAAENLINIIKNSLL